MEGARGACEGACRFCCERFPVHISLRSLFAIFVRAQDAGWGLARFALCGLGCFLLSFSVLAEWSQGSPRWLFSTVSHTSLSAAVTYGCQSFGRTVDSSQDDGNYAWSGMCSGDMPITGTRSWVCPDGFHDSGTYCVNDGCAAMGGMQMAYDVRITGASSCGSPPAYACFEGQCRGSVITASCTAFAAQGVAPAVAFWSGVMQMVTSGPCETGDVVATQAILNPGTSGGGAGVTSGEASSDSNATNLARIATNTARLVALGGGTGGGGGTCGGYGQDPCAIAEGDTSAARASADSAVGAAQSSTSSAWASRQSQMSMGALPSFDGSASKWTLSFTPFFEASGALDCKYEKDIEVVGQTMKAGFNMCPYTDDAKQILYWIFAVSTAVAIWFTIYGRA